MPSEPCILGFDTSAAHCAAALLCGGHLVAERMEAMDRGQAERLMPLLEELLAGAGRGWGDLDALAVGTGPGNFTGIRLAVAAARGLALALGIPAMGVTGFEWMRDPDVPSPRAELVSLPAPQGMAYVQRFAAGTSDGAPQSVDPSAPPLALAAPGLVVRGHRAAEIAIALGAAAVPQGSVAPAPRLVRIAAGRWQVAGPRPAPVYLRPAVAAPPRAAPVVLLDDA